MCDQCAFDVPDLVRALERIGAAQKTIRDLEEQRRATVGRKIAVLRKIAEAKWKLAEAIRVGLAVARRVAGGPPLPTT